MIILLHTLQVPSESLNGHLSTVEGDDDDSSSGAVTPNGIPIARDSRSTSASLPDRARATVGRNSPKPNGTSANPSSSHHNHHTTSTTHRSRRSSSHEPSNLGAPGTSPRAARDTFMNYFFGGQTGPGQSSTGVGQHTNGPSSAIGLSSMFGSKQDASGKDVAPNDGEPLPGLNPRNRTDGSNAAYDMKSLGKHIEAVRDPLSSSLLS